MVDILYVSAVDNNGNITVKRSDDRYETKLDFIKKLPHYVIKSYPWMYENEVRLIIKVDKEFVPVGVNVVKIEFSKNEKKHKDFRVFHAPYVEQSKPEYNLSALKGTIDWDLCRDCDMVCIKECNERKKNELRFFGNKRLYSVVCIKKIEGHSKYAPQFFLYTVFLIILLGR